MSKPDISVIITVYNRMSFIDNCIMSVLDLTDVNCEVILIDDGSTDRSLEICRSYEARYCNVKVISLKNSGISVARNAGLDSARGDYICFLDDDDVMTPGGLKVMLEAMKNYDVDIVVGNYEKVNEDGSFSGGSNMPEYVKNKVLNPDEYWAASFDPNRTWVFTVNWAKLYKKEIWEGLRFPPEFRKSEDEYVLADILEKTNKVFVADYIVVKQTITKNSISRAPFCLNTLRSPETKLVTTSKLINQKKYQFAIIKWSYACGEIMSYTKRAKTTEISTELKRLYDISVVQGKKLFKYFNPEKKVKFIAYRFMYPCFKYLP